MLRLILLVLLTSLVSLTATADTNVTVRTTLPRVNRTATLQQQLNSRLRATNEQQKAYIRLVVKRVEEGKLPAALVIAIQRKAVGRNRFFPFPFFERGMRVEAAKRNVELPLIQQLATTKPQPTLR